MKSTCWILGGVTEWVGLRGAGAGDGLSGSCMGCSGLIVMGEGVGIGGLIGYVRPRDVGADEGASGLVIMGKVMPSELGPTENKARHEVLGVGHLVGHVQGRA
jgi:hypothetical protein